MTIDRAKKIFLNIESDNFTTNEKIGAVNIVLSQLPSDYFMHERYIRVFREIINELSKINIR